MLSHIFTAAFLVAVVNGQQACSVNAEAHPSLSWSKCATGGACTPVCGAMVVDANWRWIHTVADQTSCMNGNSWNASICTSDVSCAAACCLDGQNDYAGTYGVTAAADALTMKLVTKGTYNTNVGSRMYLMASPTQYQTFNLLGQEFSFDVDVSKLPCGTNGALYFVSMDADGGMSKYPTNMAGAKYGTGYCDAQCTRDGKFVNGVANFQGMLSPSSTGPAASEFGACCPELDLWEANKMATAFTAHPCTNTGYHSCNGTACSTNDCDPAGCDFNPYRLGATNFYGPGLTVDTSSKFTVVTQFPTNANGSLSSINRYYIQNGKQISNPNSIVPGGSTDNSLNDNFCTAEMIGFNETSVFQTRGGMTSMGLAMQGPMVLVLSLWDDHSSANMNWLDSTWPVNSTQPGAPRGPCAATSGNATDIETNSPDSAVIFSNIRFGPTGSTSANVTTGPGDYCNSANCVGDACPGKKASASSALRPLATAALAGLLASVFFVILA